LCFRIDSYYLLMVKVDIRDTITPEVYFVDMLDFLGCVTFDSGPGQIMLKARAFFRAIAEGFAAEQRTLEQKVERLMELLEDGERRLAANRAESLASFRKRVQGYRKAPRHMVTPASQEALNLR
ncbi:MAG: hypothetical protein FJY85_25535, partial [Deltaproteobacteria bacterium]|nr:hypothetical protein [Deltaproteobacteria bacterium]